MRKSLPDDWLEQLAARRMPKIEFEEGLRDGQEARLPQKSSRAYLSGYALGLSSRTAEEPSSSAGAQ